MYSTITKHIIFYCTSASSVFRLTLNKLCGAVQNIYLSCSLVYMGSIRRHAPSEMLALIVVNLTFSDAQQWYPTIAVAQLRCTLSNVIQSSFKTPSIDLPSDIYRAILHFPFGKPSISEADTRPFRPLNSQQYVERSHALQQSCFYGFLRCLSTAPNVRRSA